MHPNYTPKKIVSPPEWASDDPYEVMHRSLLAQPVNQTGGLHFPRPFYNHADREPAWKTIMAPGRMKGSPRNIDGFNVPATRRDQKLAKRENSKTSTDSFISGTLIRRSWRPRPKPNRVLLTTMAALILCQEAVKGSPIA